MVGRYAWWGMLLWLLTPWLAWSAAVRITVPAAAIVSGDDITIGSIAEVQGSPPEMVERVRRVVIGQAPQPGEERALYGPYLATRLKQAGLDDEVSLDAPAKIHVTRAAQRLDALAMEEVVRQTFVRRMPWTAQQATVRDIQGLDTLVVSPGPVHYDVSFPAQSDFVGRVSFTLEVRIHGNLEKKLHGTVHIEVMQDVVTLTRPVAPQEVITRENIRMQTVSVTRSSQQVLTRPEEVIGMRAKRPLRANATIRSNDIETLPLVHKGDQVLIIAESSLIKVTAVGEALEQGQQGETIRVKNPTSNREIRAIVIGPKTVRVTL